MASSPLEKRQSLHTSTRHQDKDAHVLQSEEQTLLAKGAVEMIPLVNSGLGFYSHCFHVPKKEAGLRSILDLSHLNCLLMRQPF